MTSIQRLEVAYPPAPDRPELAGPEHPIRRVTREVAFEPGGWTPERARKIMQLFDALAPERHTRMSESRLEPRGCPRK